MSPMFRFSALAVCILGAVVWGVAPNEKPKVIEAGKLAYFAGLLTTLLTLKAIWLG